MTRLAVSIPSNIAEGAERVSIPEFSRFLYIARGSAAELRRQLYIASKVGIINITVASRLISGVSEISAMIRGLAKSLKNLKLNHD